MDQYVGGKIPYSDKVIQNINSGICGYYCLYFLHYMSYNKDKTYLNTYQDFINSFDDVPLKNGGLLKKYFKPL